MLFVLSKDSRQKTYFSLSYSFSVGSILAPDKVT